MSKKKVKERIEMYSQISRMKEVSIHKFGIYYHPKEKMWFLYLNYKTIEKDKETEEKRKIHMEKIIQTYNFKIQLREKEVEDADKAEFIPSKKPAIVDAFFMAEEDEEPPPPPGGGAPPDGGAMPGGDAAAAAGGGGPVPPATTLGPV